jgi:hypothetical protein
MVDYDSLLVFRDLFHDAVRGEKLWAGLSLTSSSPHYKE